MTTYGIHIPPGSNPQTPTVETYPTTADLNQALANFGCEDPGFTESTTIQNTGIEFHIGINNEKLPINVIATALMNDDESVHGDALIIAHSTAERDKAQAIITALTDALNSAQEAITAPHLNEETHPRVTLTRVILVPQGCP